MRRVRTKRVTIDGKPWKIKLQRPPTRGVNDGLCEPNDRIVYIHPDAIAHCGVETVCHELMHARFYDIDEPAVEEFGRLVGEVVAWVARQNEGVIA